MIYSFSLSKHLLFYLIFGTYLLSYLGSVTPQSLHIATVTLGCHVLCLLLSNTVYLLLGPSLSYISSVLKAVYSLALSYRLFIPNYIHSH